MRRHSPDVMEAAEPITPLAILVRQVKDPLIYILVVAAAVTVLLGEYADAVVITAVIIINIRTKMSAGSWSKALRSVFWQRVIASPWRAVMGRDAVT